MSHFLHPFVKFQSTLPRGERHFKSKPSDALIEISIHAPAGGATNAQVMHRLRKLFQSTLPRGERLLPNGLTRIPIRISIHAPAGGATAFVSMPTSAVDLFQSTLPRGERLSACCCAGAVTNFNPRSRGGSDLRYRVHPMNRYFNPRSRGGSDMRFVHQSSISLNFNPRSRGGSDAIIDNGHAKGLISIHAPAGGATVA